METRQDPSGDPAATVKSADRVLDLFELLAREGPAMTHAAMAQSLRVPKSSLSKLLSNLVGRGYVAYSAAGRTYRLGAALADLVLLADPGRAIIDLAAPVLTAMAAATRESCSLSLLRGDRIEAAAAVNSPQPLLSHMQVGDHAPLYASSGGKAMLAWLPAATRADYLARVVLTPITPHTLRSPAALGRELAAIRRDGVAYSRQEITIGIVSLGAAVLRPDGAPAAALNIAMPTVRFDEAAHRRCRRALQDGVAELARMIGRGP